MRELWLAKDEASIIFDTREYKEILGCPKFESDVVVQLTDNEYADYCRVLAEFYTWQRRFENLIAGSDSRTVAS
jgi:hypothetical protein